MACSWRNALATLMPLIVSWTWALTSARARLDRGLGERLRIRRDAADDFAGGDRIVERQIALEHGVEGVLAQLEHHVADRLRGLPAPEEVERPGQAAQKRDDDG